LYNSQNGQFDSRARITAETMKRYPGQLRQGEETMCADDEILGRNLSRRHFLSKIVNLPPLAAAALGVASAFSRCAVAQAQPANSAARDDDIPVLETNGTQNVIVHNKRLRATWLLQIPEVVGSEQAWYMSGLEPISVQWERHADGEIGYTWEGSAEWRERAHRHDTLTDAGHLSPPLRPFPMLPGIGVSLRMRPSEDRVDLSIALTNLTDHPLEQVWSDGGCLGAKTEAFFDNDASRSYIETSHGLTQLSEIDRTQKLRCRYVFEPEWYDRDAVKIGEWFWGRSSQRPQSAFVGALASDRRGAVGIGYDHSRAIWQNSDEHHCMHSEPYSVLYALTKR
jgi:hypothetical protein